MCSLMLPMSCMTGAISIFPAFQKFRRSSTFITRSFPGLPPGCYPHLGCSSSVFVNWLRRILCPYKLNNDSSFCVRSSSETSSCLDHQFLNVSRMEDCTLSMNISLRAFRSKTDSHVNVLDHNSKANIVGDNVPCLILRTLS